MYQKLTKLCSALWLQREHLLYRLNCQKAHEPNAEADTEVHVLSAESATANCRHCAALVRLNQGNHEYIRDVERGHAIAVLIYVDRELAHHGFLFMRNRMRCLLGAPRNAALLGHAHTLPKFRGRGLQGMSISTRARLARELGFSYVYAETAPGNIASQRGMARAGMICIGMLKFLCVLRVFVYRWQRPQGVKAFSICVGT